MPSALRSMVIIPVPEAADAVDRWREETCNDKPSIGVPAHITLIFPFVPAGRGRGGRSTHRLKATGGVTMERAKVLRLCGYAAGVILIVFGVGTIATG